jgi:phosphoribosyl-dephospho-CoA transferase
MSMRRHDFVWIRPERWEAALGAHAADRLAREWAACGRPLVGRRLLPEDRPGVPLGLPTPPSDGKRRLSFVVPHDAIARTMRPPTLADSLGALPRSWQWTAARIAVLGERHAATVRVFGSAAFQLLTGLDYLTPSSDLDLLIDVGVETDVALLVTELGKLAGDAPMVLDGEIMGPQGAACKWREIGAETEKVLIRTASRTFLGNPARIWSAGAGP